MNKEAINRVGLVTNLIPGSGVFVTNLVYLTGFAVAGSAIPLGELKPNSDFCLV